MKRNAIAITTTIIISAFVSIASLLVEREMKVTHHIYVNDLNISSFMVK